MIKKPMLAGKLEDIKSIRYPVLVTPKLDGIRCLKLQGQALSRKFKPIANKFIRGKIETHCPDGVDGELIAGKTFSEATSLIGSADGEPVFEYHVFDYVTGNLAKGYASRIDELRRDRDAGVFPEFVKFVLPKLVRLEDELLEWEQKFLDEGYEGLMLRSLNSPYKCGRSTTREGYLLKMKRFYDAEALVLGFTEMVMNTNTLEKDALGHAKRSKHQAGMVGKNTLGSIQVRDIKTGVEFSIGAPDMAMADEIWKNQEKYLGKVLTYTYQAAGVKDKPRFPGFKGFRNEDDYGE